MNCLAYALRFWERYPEYKLYYNSDHVINSREMVQGTSYLPAEDYGFTYFRGAFDGLLDLHEQKLLRKYFNVETNMFDEMKAAGSNLPDMVEALQLAGWKTHQHHDNWVCAEFPHGMDTHAAFNTLSFIDKFKPEQLRFNKRLDDSFKNNPINEESNI